jgi:hypothetical protein
VGVIVRAVKMETTTNELGARSSGVTRSSWPLLVAELDTLRHHLRDCMP